MSHFSVAVITNKKPSKQTIAEILAPYNEGIEVPRYIRMTKEQIIASKRKRLEDYKESHAYKAFHADPEKYAREHAYNPGHVEYLKTGYDEECAKSDQEIYEDYIRYYEKEEISPDGGVYSTENPNAKWDWYEIGGRWNGSLPVGTRTVNTAKISNVNWGRMEVSEYLKANPEKEEEYAKRIHDCEIFTPEYFRKRYRSLEDFAMQEMSPQTYAVIVPNKNGEYEWHEAGKCRMFGISEATPEEQGVFAREYYDRFIEPNMDKYITIVDCHI